jgi:hypothetical protein
MNHLATPYASAFDVPILGSVVSLTVQVFFAYRIWVLGEKESWWLSLVICSVSLDPGLLVSKPSDRPRSALLLMQLQHSLEVPM